MSVVLATSIALITPALVTASYAQDVNSPEVSEEKQKGNKGKRGGIAFEDLDADGNGIVSLEEFKNVNQMLKFAQADTNSDGIFSAEEIEAYGESLEERMQKRFQRMKERLMERVDTNDDGQIDATEIEASQQVMFDRLDADSNGELSEEELEKASKRGGKRDKSKKS